MNFRIADSFTSSLARLTNDEQKAVKITVFDLQSDPVNPGLQLHRIDRCKDPNFWSARVGRDIRLIVHKTDASLLICYVDHHDKAYDWAARRKVETHPRTGAAQFVEIRELVREIEIPTYVEPTPSRSEPAAPLFADLPDDQLLGYGVPEEWLPDAKAVTEDTLFDLAEHLPSEAAEALLELATGGTPQAAAVAAPSADPFHHPDAQRRFRTMASADELRQALEYPWEKWTVFLHPSQRDLVDRSYSGPARVAGSAGTGKTVVAIHRAAALARRSPGARILLTTFSTVLARSLRRKLDRLLAEDAEARNRVTVRAIDQVALDLYEASFGKPRIPTPGMIRTLLGELRDADPDNRFSLAFMEAEWRDVVDAWQLESWEAYRDVARLGRKTRLGENQRASLWAIFEGVRRRLDERGLTTLPTVFAKATELVQESESSPFDHAIVDEAQDMGVPQLRFLAALPSNDPDALFFAGDLGQRIFQTPFSWKSLGVDIRGRSHTLRVNYRTSQQIRQQADRLLPESIADVDGNTESRSGTISAFAGPPPTFLRAESLTDEIAVVAEWLKALIAEGFPPEEIGVIVRSPAQLDRVKRAIAAAGHEAITLDGNNEPTPGNVSACTMHMAKGLEFRAVGVMACDDEIVPLQERIEGITDEGDLEDVYNTERHLLYVACTRARDRLLVSGVDPVSEFVEDMAETAH